MNVPKLVKDCFTGPDGVTWAIGRVYSLPLLASGIALPFVMLWRAEHFTLTDAGLMYGGLGTAVWAMIRGTNSTEPPAVSS